MTGAKQYVSRVLWQIRREFSAFFFSPLAYVVLGASILVNGGVFLFIVAMLQGPHPLPGAPMEFLFSTIFFWITLLTITPLITMRSLAEEFHTGTFELLATSPLTDTQIVLSKYASCLSFYVIAWLPTLAFPLMLHGHVAIDPGPLAAGFTGVVLIGTMMVAVGVLASAITRNQMVAAIVAFSIMIGFLLVGLLADVDKFQQLALFEYLNLYAHMADFSRGIVDTRPIVYYGSMAVLTVFATVQIIGRRRWIR